MSEAVTVALITNVAIILSAIIGKLDRKKLTQKVELVSNKIKGVESKVDDNTKITNEVKVQTDGIKDELVLATRKLGEAEGNKQGRAEMKMEAEALVREPIKVEIVNESIPIAPANKQE